MPSATTTNRWKRAQGRRSNLAGTVVLIELPGFEPRTAMW
jgi:hypothetical protein